MYQRKPEWLKIKTIGGKNRTQVEKLLASLSLHTVCKEAACPNIMECFSRKTATFMILGNHCTRNCTFCNVEKGTAMDIDREEPEKIAEAAGKLGLKHVVITSVTRDDLPDGGAGHFASVIEKVRSSCEGITIEVLIPDFKGDEAALGNVVSAAPDIINHNIETVHRLYPEVRPQADYSRSLRLLRNVKEKDSRIYTKSGIMVGLGEKPEEVTGVFRDLREYGCDILTIGQYIAPSLKHYPVVEFITPEMFEKYKASAYRLGFSHVTSGPLVRSSYHADNALDSLIDR